MSQEDICLSCTLPICDDESKECAYLVQIVRPAKKRYWTKQNEKRRNLFPKAKKGIDIDALPKYKRRLKKKPEKLRAELKVKDDRTEYFANYYQRHREAKKAAALARYYAKRAV